MDTLQFCQTQLPAEPDFPNKVRCHYEDPFVVPKMAKVFCQFLESYQVSQNDKIIIVGIGTDRSTGDSLGPLVGAKLSDFAKKSFSIYGTLDEPVHATNLDAKIKEIDTCHKGAFVVAIDACLGKLDNVGMITLAPGSVKPGAGVQKNLPGVGHIHFTGTVNVGGCMEFMVLQNTRLSIVMKLAKHIANIIFYGYHKFLLNQTNSLRAYKKS